MSKIDQLMNDESFINELVETETTDEVIKVFGKYGVYITEDDLENAIKAVMAK